MTLSKAHRAITYLILTLSGSTKTRALEYTIKAPKTTLKTLLKLDFKEGNKGTRL